jgi:hypothetical protein
MSAFFVFFCQSPSFLAFQRLMQQASGVDNAVNLFGVDDIPTDNQIRNILDTVDPNYLRPVFHDTFEYLKEQGTVERFRSFANTLLVPIDGTGYFRSETIHCESCTVTHHNDGRVNYSHQALLPAIVKPGCEQVIPLEPEFIHPQEGHEKQDCEQEAAKQWITSAGAYYSREGITLLGDDIYACQPIISMAREEELEITNKAGKTIRRFSFVTNHPITEENVESLVEAGRCRWKIENEDINTLKTKGYHFDHNFGHGKSFLAQPLLSLNIIAFLFHTILELLDEQCAWFRKTLPRRDMFFQHIAALTQYLCFASWQSLLAFMIRGLKEGPGTPPDPFTVIT